MPYRLDCRALQSPKTKLPTQASRQAIGSEMTMNDHAPPDTQSLVDANINHGLVCVGVSIIQDGISV